MKRLMCLLICGVLVLGVAGCGNEDDSKDRKNDSTKSSVKDNNLKDEVVVEEKTYYCEEADDDDWYYYFYFENDELVRSRILAAKWSGAFEEYSYIKSEASKYDGVTISKDSEYVYFDVDIKNGGIKYLTEMFWLFESLEEDTSFNDITEFMRSISYQCEIQ